jgi:hypothetical protein
MKSKTIIIGIAGYAGSGKSTVADILVREHGFERIKFADGLKDMLRALGLSEGWIEGELKEQPCPLFLGHTPRHAMQTLGTEWGRACIGEDFWVKYWTMRVKGRLNTSGASRIVVDDVRYPNELEAVEALSGRLWWISRPGVRPSSYHSSEHALAQEKGRFEEINNGGFGPGLMGLKELISSQLEGGADHV